MRQGQQGNVMGIYACPKCGNPNGWWSGNMRDVHDCPGPPRLKWPERPEYPAQLDWSEVDNMENVMNMDEARRILDAQDTTDPARALVAAGHGDPELALELTLRYAGIVHPTLLPVAEKLEAIAADFTAGDAGRGARIETRMPIDFSDGL